MRSNTHSGRGDTGFTLVELLVVMGIIAVLISILLPALSRAREHAINIQCMSNMRQMGQMLSIYANDQKDYPWYSYPGWPPGGLGPRRPRVR